MIPDILTAIAALVFVLTLLLGGMWLLKRFGVLGVSIATPNKDIQILAQRALDVRTRLVVARWRGEDYLIAIGPEGIAPIDQKESPTNEMPPSRGNDHV